MKRKLISVGIALALACSLGLMTAVPAGAAADTWYVDDDGGADFTTIQAAVGEAVDGDTIIVAEGEYAGAIVNEDLMITGAAGGESIITSGVPYKSGSTLETGFRLDADADGAEIRNFTMNGDFFFAVYARNADDVIVDSLTLDHMVQGITNWGGSGWEITNNVITETYPTTGGGIAIQLGADPTDFPHCDNNLVQGNIMSTSAVQNANFTGAAIALWFDMRGITEMPTGVSMTGNEIIGNSITASGLENQVGIEIGVGGLEGDTYPDRVAACLGVIHGNTVQDNTVDNAEWGLYLYVTTNLTVSGNTITNCSDCGIYMKDDHANYLVNNNSIYGNTNYGLNNTDGATYERTVDATKNWWGGVAGPQHSTNPYNTEATAAGSDNVTDNVDYLPWMIHTKLQEGWNIYSTPIAPDASSNTIDKALDLWGSSSGDKLIAYYYNTETQYWDEPSSLTPLQAVYIKMAAAATIDVVVSSEATFPPSTDMHVGWNLVGPAELGKRPVDIALEDAFWGTGVAADLQGYSKALSPPLHQSNWTYLRGGDNKDKYFVPTEAYWVLMVNQGILGGVTTTPIYYELP